MKLGLFEAFKAIQIGNLGLKVTNGSLRGLEKSAHRHHMYSKGRRINLMEESIMSIRWSTRRKTREEIEQENERQADAMEELEKALEQKKLEREAEERAKMPTFKRRF